MNQPQEQRSLRRLWEELARLQREQEFLGCRSSRDLHFLPGEGSAVGRAAAEHWASVYRELIGFKEGLVADMRRRAQGRESGMGPELLRDARRIQPQLERLYVHLRFWEIQFRRDSWMGEMPLDVGAEPSTLALLGPTPTPVSPRRDGADLGEVEAFAGQPAVSAYLREASASFRQVNEAYRALVQAYGEGRDDEKERVALLQATRALRHAVLAQRRRKGRWNRPPGRGSHTGLQTAFLRLQAAHEALGRARPFGPAQQERTDFREALAAFRFQVKTVSLRTRQLRGTGGQNHAS